MGWVIVGTFIIIALFTLLPDNRPLDDTDNRLTGERSGMRILIDHGTGCQYLGYQKGGVTPRLDKAGIPMCGGSGK